MVRVQYADRKLRPDVNATFGEDGAPVAKRFVPALSRLGFLDTIREEAARAARGGSVSSLDPQVGNGLSPGTLQFDPTLGGALAPARGPVKSGGTWLPTSTLLLVGGGLLALGTVTYFIARSVR